MFSVCFAQNINKVNIQICYGIGSPGIGGQDHCVTIWFEDSLIFVRRICYSRFNNTHKYYTNTDLNRYYEARKQEILRHYQEFSDSLVLDERIEIDNAQFDEFVKIINEIKAFMPEDDNNNDEVIITTKGDNHYVITDEDGITMIVDFLGHYDRSRDIEKALGLKSYLRCPCVEKDLKQTHKSKNERSNS
jgi:hypothetical protein